MAKEKKKPSPNDYSEFQVLQAEMHAEQAHYWTRFIGFATLHAGLFVLATSSVVASSTISGLLIPAVGVTLSVVWIEVQRLSLHYLKRWKPRYHQERESLGLDFPAEHTTSRTTASTVLAILVPSAVLIVWLTLFLPAICKAIGKF